MYQRKRLPGLLFISALLSTPLTSATKPAPVFPEPNQIKVPNLRSKTVAITRTVDGYTCTITGVISYFNLDSKIKALREWERTADRWFGNTPIDQVISKPFVTVINKP